ncbi:MAG: hypothetical protein ACHREM_19235 [Polyangiales bacterium]
MKSTPFEGWMERKSPRSKVYHYIVDGGTLCGWLVFYYAELAPYDPTDTHEPADCAECFRLAAKRHAKRHAKRQEDHHV